MACTAGYPASPCPFNFAGRVTRESCGKCKFFEPPKFILKHCSLWDRDKELCYLPKSHCPTCPFYVVRGVGRPRGEGKYDFSNPEDRLKYEAEWRRKNTEKLEAIRVRFREAHPDYWKNYKRPEVKK